MASRTRCRASGRELLLIALAVCASLAAPAQVAKRRASSLDDLAFAKPETRLAARHETCREVRAEGSDALPLVEACRAFSAERNGSWTFVLDRMSGALAMAEGRGIPWIPGRANALSSEALGLQPGLRGQDVPVGAVAEEALDFIRSHPGLLAARPEELVLNEQGSGPLLDYLYYVDLAWTYHGLPVEGAHVSFRINHGNLVQFGQERVSGSIRRLDPSPTLTSVTAWEILWGYLGGRRPDDRMLEAGRLLVMPVLSGEAVAGTTPGWGTGLAYRLVYVLVFSRPGEAGTWEGRVDARTGELLSFGDTNAYGHIQGGTYVADQVSSEVTRAFPWANYSGTTGFADGAGEFPGTTGTSTLQGQYVRIVSHRCGDNAISQSSDGAGLIDFGTSSGTDCDTPGHGGNGNSHAARTQYWNTTQIKLKALAYLPGNAWLNGTLTEHVNLTDADYPFYCPGNAWWSSSEGTLNFCQSGGGSWGNTGELPSIAMHEWAHGLDARDGSPSGDPGTGETYGDFSAVLQTWDSCVGAGYFIGNYCSGYGDLCSGCSGIRDIDYANHGSGQPHFPEDFVSNTCTGCTPYQCGSGMCAGPCGLECHCESYVASEALWDFVNRDLAGPPWYLDAATAWQVADRLWYASRPIAGQAFTCPAPDSADGCGLANYYTVLRLVDDNDGDLANGTPHAQALFDAFNRHKIACSAGNHNNDSTGCPSLPAPTAWVMPGIGQNLVAWTPVASAFSYLVLRNETGCDRGYSRIARVEAGTTSFLDISVVDGAPYHYRVQALGPSEACPGALSACAFVPCAPPSPPSDLQAIASGSNTVYLSWAASPTTGATHTLYRSGGACPGGALEILATGLSENTFVDTTASAGLTYSYQAAARLGSCESDYSNCDSATPSGSCQRAPAFDGIQSASSGLESACSITLCWDAAVPLCAGPVTYNVYRAPYPFAPGPAYRIASGISLTFYSDVSALQPLTPYYYLVRSVDGASGLEDSNMVTAVGCATSALADWLDDVEPTAEPGWTHGFYLGSDGWAVSTAEAHSPSHAWRNADAVSGKKDRWLVSPPLLVSSTTELSFWHSYYFISNTYTNDPRNGGVLEISTDGGVTWSDLGPLMTEGGYTGTVWVSSGNPLAGRAAWIRYQPSWTRVRVALNAYAGSRALVRWRMACVRYSSEATEYWNVDDLQFTQVGAACAFTSAPPAVPNGSNGTAPVRGAKVPGWNGTLIDVTWDASACAGAVTHGLIYGRGEDLPTDLGGPFNGVYWDDCDIGSTGYYSWYFPADPAWSAKRFYWWLLVSTDGVTEGSWGGDSGNFERNGLTPSPCASVKIPTNACGI